MTRVVALGGGHGLAASLQAARRYAGRRARRSCRWPTTAGPAAGCGPRSASRRRATCAAAWSPWPTRLAVGDGLRAPLRRRRARGPRPRQPRHRRAGRHHRRLRGRPGRGRPAARRRGPGAPRHRRAGRAQGRGPGRRRRRRRLVEGQVAVADAGRIAGVSLVPADAEPPPAALEAIAAADQVVHRPRLAVHQRPGRGGRARHPRGARGHARPRRSTSATCGAQSPRPPATTWPPTSTPCGPTASSSTSCCADPGAPAAGGTCSTSDVRRAAGGPTPTALAHDPGATGGGAP